MVKVECEGCKAPYQVDEKRIPPTGLKMRCPKCGTSFLVTLDGVAADGGAIDLPAPRTSSSTADTAPSAPRKPSPAAPPAPARPAVPTVASPARPGGPPRPAAPAATVAFGDIDLPVAASAPPRGAPPPARPAAPARPGPPQAPPAKPVATLGFGELDLGGAPPSSSAPHAPLSEQPISAIPISSLPPSGGDLGTLDLPSLPAKAPPPGVIDLPSVSLPAPPAPPAARRPDANADLPLARPAPPAGRTQQGVGPGAPAFGEIDLPVRPAAPPRAAPPAAARAPEPPRAPAPNVTAPGGFGEIDLPLVGASHPRNPTRPGPPAGADLPAPVSAGLPMAAQPSVGLPAPAFGSVGLPAPVATGLPVAVQAGLPSPVNVGLPVVGGPGLPATATDIGMPTPATALGMPAPASAGLPAASDSGFPSGPPISLAPGLPVRGGDVVGAELYGSNPPLPPLSQRPISDIPDMPIALQSLPPSAGAYPPPASPTPPPPESIEIDSAAAPRVGPPGTMAGAGLAAGTAGGMPAVKIAPRRSNARRFLLLGVATLIIAGASLTLVDGVGPFGLHYFNDLIGAGGHNEALRGLRAEAQQKLSSDTYADAEDALNLARARHEAAPRHAPTTAYLAYLTFMKSLRFGRSAGEESQARQDTDRLPPGRPEAELHLASAGALAIQGNLAGARSALGPLTSDVDALVLAGEVELAAKAPPAAVTAWTAAVATERSARTLFGLARAQLAAGDAASAEKSATEVTTLSKNHAGARTLLAQIRWDQHKEEAARKLLDEVLLGDQNPIKASASGIEQVEAYALLGRIHLARSRMSMAEKAFEEARKLDPQSVPALLGLGDLFYRSGRYTEAKGRFEAALSADADSTRAAVGRAKTELALGNIKEAKEQLTALRTKKPNDALVALWLGQVEDKLNAKKDAEKSFLEAIKIGGTQPEAIEAYVALASLLAGQARNADATAKLAEASKKFPDSPLLNRARGAVASRAGRLDEAKSEFEAALAKDDDTGTRFELGQVLRQMRRFDEAEAEFVKVESADKDYPGLIVERGLIFEGKGQSDKALELYEQALKKAPTDVDLKLRIGETMVKAGQPNKKAIDLLREVYKARPTAESAHYLGRALLLDGGNLAEAQRLLEEAVNKDPDQADHQLYAGWVANETGNFARATDALKAALALDKENGDVYWQRSVLNQKLGQCFDALEDVKLALQKKPARFEAYATMAICLSEQSKWPETIDAYNKAIAGNPNVAEWHYQLGRALEASGSGGGAATEHEKALALLEASQNKKSAWAYHAHLQVADAAKDADAEKAEKNYTRFLELAPPNHPDRKRVQAWLDQRRRR